MLIVFVSHAMGRSCCESRPSGLMWQMLGADFDLVVNNCGFAAKWDDYVTAHILACTYSEAFQEDAASGSGATAASPPRQ